MSKFHRGECDKLAWQQTSENPEDKERMCSQEHYYVCAKCGLDQNSENFMAPAVWPSCSACS